MVKIIQLINGEFGFKIQVSLNFLFSYIICNPSTLTPYPKANPIGEKIGELEYVTYAHIYLYCKIAIFRMCRIKLQLL